MAYTPRNNYARLLVDSHQNDRMQKGNPVTHLQGCEDIDRYSNLHNTNRDGTKNQADAEKTC